MTLPRPLDRELPRERLVRALARRWDHALTLVVAGAGFGKTTALAQSVRASALAPPGLDAWVSCDARHEDAAYLAGALLDALSEAAGPRGPVDVRRVIAALVALAPSEVCLILDDVHEIPPRSSGAALLRELTGALPATVHLVLSGREPPAVPVARREAAGAVLRLGADELAFTDEEAAALGRNGGSPGTGVTAYGGSPGTGVTAYGGWPALVRLACAAERAAPLRYVREEILAGLSDAERRSLAVLAALGTATPEEVRTVLPDGVGPEELARRVPLLSSVGTDRFRAHDLWGDAVAAALPEPELRALRRRAVALLAARGELSRAGALAMASADWDRLGELAVKLVRETLTALPLATAERWLGLLPAGVSDRPAFTLLRAAALHARDYAHPGVDDLLDAAWRGALAAGCAETASAALGHAVVAAHSRADLPRLAALAPRADAIRTSPSPVVRLLRHSVAGVLAELSGDPDAAVTAFAAAPVREVPPLLATPVLRFHAHCLTMTGRTAEAAVLADRALADADDVHTRLTGALARWSGGDPADLDRLRSSAALHPDAGPAATDTVREAFVTRAQAAVLAASWGRAAEWPPYPAGRPEDHDNARDAVLACAAAASVAAGRGDEAGARRLYADQLGRWPLTAPVAERHLRRFLALGYVLDERLAAHWDATDLGPAHVAARDAGRALRRARDGDPGPAAALPPESALCFLPLPWSVELAARLAGAHHPAGLRLGQWLADRLGAAVHDEFRRAGPASPGAARFLATLPAPPVARLGIAVIGPLRLTRDGVPVEPADAPELRRARVRQLLSALVLTPRLDRGRAIRLLWPDQDPASAAANLRVTLTHLRRLLEPDRSGGAAGFHLRTDADCLRLHRSEWLSVDLWAADELAGAADAARRAGDTDRAMELLRRAVSLWRGDPLGELADVGDLDAEAEVARVRARHVRSLLALGTLRLVCGDAQEAYRLAGQALDREPYEATGHRLLLAAALRTGDPARVEAARLRVVTALRELATAPDPPTAILLRRARPRSRLALG